MHKKDMVDAMLGKIEQAIIRILNNSQSIDSYHYYLITPAGMERLESTCIDVYKRQEIYTENF